MSSAGTSQPLITPRRLFTAARVFGFQKRGNEVAEVAPQFKVAIMYDENDSDPSTETDDVISDLKYAYDRYMGSQAVVPRNAYLGYNGRPMIFIFPKGDHADWSKVRRSAQRRP